MYVKAYKHGTGVLVDEGFATLVDTDPNFKPAIIDVYWTDSEHSNTVTHASTYSGGAHYLTVYKEKPE
jgi:hypothetical protein